MFKFYDIDKNYVNFLKSFEEKIPNISYEKRDKFMCGVVLKINNFDYFAPVSSFKKQQRTNFLIKNSKNKEVGSIRLSFMFPVPKELAIIKDFKKEELNYRRLLNEELSYCNNHSSKIYRKAEFIYNSVCDKTNDIMVKNCCDFKLLEKKSFQYCKEHNLKLPLSPVQIKNPVQDFCKAFSEINNFLENNEFDLNK